MFLPIPLILLGNNLAAGGCGLFPKQQENLVHSVNGGNLHT